MSLYHGTSAGAALKILENGDVKPSKDGYFYTFDGNRPESLAGALCFATGDGPRNGSLKEKNFFKRYTQLNPNFPTGLKGIFAKAALKMAARSWAKEQLKSATTDADRAGAIMVYADNSQATARCRGGFVNEMKLPAAGLGTLKLERVYLDDALLKTPEVQKLQAQGIVIEPLSHCTDKIWKDCAAAKAAKKSAPKA
ncbi:MAG: hypothetical protein ACAH80_10825 [Alphaproteobacteria bacterium]